MSNHVDQVEKIETWSDYAEFFKQFYEAVTDSGFAENKIRNLDEKDQFFDLENNTYIFLDNTINSTYHIMNLYNHHMEDEQPKAIYDQFISTQIAGSRPSLKITNTPCRNIADKWAVNTLCLRHRGKP